MKRSLDSRVAWSVVLAASALLLGWLRIMSANTYPVLSEAPQPSPQSVNAIAIGDISCAPDTVKTSKACQAQAVHDAIKNANPQALLLLGDLQYDRGEPAHFKNIFGPVWQDMKDISYASTGNHDHATTDAKGYFDYWNGTEPSSEHAGERGKGYYSFDKGAWHIIALNSNCEYVGGCGADSPQGQWLVKDLSDNRETKCTLAFWHHPRFTSGIYYNHPSTNSRSVYFWQELDRAGADVILNGHDHLYERMAKQSADGQANGNGIRQFTVGTGGRSLYSLKTKTPRHEFGVSTFGYLQLNLKSNGYDWSFKTPENKELDKGTGTCNNPYKLLQSGV